MCKSAGSTQEECCSFVHTKAKMWLLCWIFLQMGVSCGTTATEGAVIYLDFFFCCRLSGAGK